MIPPVFSVSMIAAPWQILVVAVLALGLFAPHVLPRIGRMLGRMVRAEAMRRLGMSVRADTRAARPTAGEPSPRPVEILMPDRPAPTLRAETEQSLIPVSDEGRPISAWLVSAAVLAIAAAIFWLLLHSR